MNVQDHFWMVPVDYGFNFVAQILRGEIAQPVRVFDTLEDDYE